MIIGKEERALEPDIICSVKSTKLGSRLVNPDLSIDVSFGIANPATERSCKKTGLHISSNRTTIHGTWCLLHPFFNQYIP